MKESLPIIIPGKGRVPRLGTMGPITTPFNISLPTLEAILRVPKSPGATFVDPKTGAQTRLTIANFKKIFADYQAGASIGADKVPEPKKEVAPPPPPKVEVVEEDVAPPVTVEEPVVDEAPAEEVVVEEPVQEPEPEPDPEPVIETTEDVVQEPVKEVEVKEETKSNGGGKKSKGKGKNKSQTIPRITKPSND